MKTLLGIIRFEGKTKSGEIRLATIMFPEFVTKYQARFEFRKLYPGVGFKEITMTQER